MPEAPETPETQTHGQDRDDLVFRALASKPRREILVLLTSGAEDGRCCSESGDVCACILAEKLGLSASTISHHMKTLVDAGLVVASKRGLWVYYRLVPEALDVAMRELAAMVVRTPNCCTEAIRPAETPRGEEVS